MILCTETAGYRRVGRHPSSSVSTSPSFSSGIDETARSFSELFLGTRAENVTIAYLAARSVLVQQERLVYASMN